MKKTKDNILSSAWNFYSNKWSFWLVVIIFFGFRMIALTPKNSLYSFSLFLIDLLGFIIILIIGFFVFNKLHSKN
jgi:hypothetical protein